MEVSCESFTLTILDEPTYSVGSKDNVRQYNREFDFTGEYTNSQHGLICREPDGTEHSCVMIAGGGTTGVHKHSVLVVNGLCYVAVGDMLCSHTLPTLNLNWAIRIDDATCFGIHYSQKHNCLLSHGEMTIARVSLLGEVIWSTSGADIFTEGFLVLSDNVEVIDFNGQLYHIDIASGQSIV